MSAPISEPLPDWVWLEEILTDEQQNKLRPKTLWVELVKRSDLKPMERLVAHTLASWSEECWISKATIAAEAGIDEKTAYRALKRLERDGWIEREMVSRRTAKITRLCWPESGHCARTEIGRAARTPHSESGHSVPRQGTQSPSEGTPPDETGHRYPPTVSAVPNCVETTASAEADGEFCLTCQGQGWLDEDLPCPTCRSVRVA